MIWSEGDGAGRRFNFTLSTERFSKRDYRNAAWHVMFAFSLRASRGGISEHLARNSLHVLAQRRHLGLSFPKDSCTALLKARVFFAHGGGAAEHGVHRVHVENFLPHSTPPSPYVTQTPLLLIF